MKFYKIVLVVFFIIYFNIVFSLSVFADVTVERFFKTGGIRGAGASESSKKEFIKGSKKREDSTMKFTGAILGKLTGEQKISAIYRVDRDLVWDINHVNKSYTERPISLPKEEESSQVEDETAAEKKEEEVRIIRNEFKVEATGKKKTINNFPCEQYILTWLVETENVKTKERSKSMMTTELWNTPEDDRIKVLVKEESEFNQAYIRKLGIEMTQEEIQKFGLNILGSAMGEAAENLKKELSKVKGYSIATNVRWEAETDERNKRQQEQEVIEEEPEKEEGIDISKGLGGIMGGILKKKGQEKQKEKKAEGKDKTSVLFESYSEVKRIDTSPIADSQFDIPSGYKKVVQ